MRSQLRPAKIADLTRIVEIYNQAVAAGATADIDPLQPEERRGWLERHLQGRYPLWVAESDEVLEGWCSLGEHRPGRRALRHTAEISYYVDQACLRRGIGSQLVQNAIASSPRLEFRTLFSILLENNSASVRLLEKFGFERWGHLPRVADFDGRELGQLIYGRRVES